MCSYDYFDYDSTAATTTSGNWIGTSGTWTDSAAYWRSVSQPRSLLVETPAHWTKEMVAAYVILVNKQTNTGWRIDYLIDGHVTICDPSIQVRSMRDFLPWLTERASLEDKGTIKKFFEAHPLDEPAK